MGHLMALICREIVVIVGMKRGLQLTNSKKLLMLILVQRSVMNMQNLSSINYEAVKLYDCISFCVNNVNWIRSGYFLSDCALFVTFATLRNLLTNLIFSYTTYYIYLDTI